MNAKIRKDFPWFAAHKDLIYFDSAATSLKPLSVLKAEQNYYIDYGTNTHNTDSTLAFKTTQRVAEIRAQSAKLFNAKAENVIFTSGTTESLNLVAKGIAHLLKAGDEILISKLEHASNLLPWIVLAKQKKLKLTYVGGEQIPTAETYLKAITKKTKVIPFSASSNILGNSFDYKKLAKQAKVKNKNIILVMDAAQYLTHHKIDTKCGIDFVGASCHKILGPTGLGLLYINSKWLDKIPPIKYGGGMNDSISPEDYVLTTGVEKFEGGTMPLGQIFGWEKAMEYMDKIGWNKISTYLVDLKKYFVQQLKPIKNITIYNEKEPECIIYFNMNKVHAQDFANWLGTKGIICRAGLSCAKLAGDIAKTQAAVRFSLHFYNTKEEIDKSVKIIKSFKKGDEIIL